jgi:predicted nucleic acid-binding protein
MKTVFLDTAFLVALINPNDQLSPQALAALEELDGTESMTTDAVLTEVLNFYAERGQSRLELLPLSFG